MKVQSISAVLFALAVAFGLSTAAAQESEPADARTQADQESVEFQRNQFTIERVRGRVYLNGSRIRSGEAVDGDWRVDVIEQLDGLSFDKPSDFSRWARHLYSPRTYTYDTVVQSDGSSTPLVLLPEETRQQIDGDWRAFASEQLAAAAARREAAARARQQSSPTYARVADNRPRWEVRLAPRTSVISNYLYAYPRQAISNYLYNNPQQAISNYVYGAYQPTSDFTGQSNEIRVSVNAYDTGDVYREIAR